MIVTFQEEYLRNLYERGDSGDKKHRFQPNIVSRYKRCIDYMKSSPKKETLYAYNSLHFESLNGDKAGLFSVRVNDQYRIEFTIHENEENKFLTVCNIVELSNHYD